MLTLYYKPSCVFSQRVIGEATALGLGLDLINISGNEDLKQIVLERGGKLQTPLFVDEEREVLLYESNDIVEYLQKHYGEREGERTFGGLRVHQSPEICESCD